LGKDIWKEEGVYLDESEMAVRHRILHKGGFGKYPFCHHDCKPI
jgi:hypothetical protein